MQTSTMFFLLHGAAKALNRHQKPSTLFPEPF